jgi:hypothetical protein
MLNMNDGVLPPDPYKDGVYENRIMGPINRIDEIQHRAPGIKFEWEGLNIIFEYKSRPVGGINSKAVLLDILGNFLVMGSASAIFFGGAHRFMDNPAKYPFPGGLKKWYSGDPLGWFTDAVKQFTGGTGSEDVGIQGTGLSVISNIMKNLKDFWNTLFSGDSGAVFGAASSLFTGATGNIINSFIAGKTAGQVPYLQGMRAILTGEPVGEWHVTIGNPLNPIAMIGNLICDGVTVEFNEELGPDDFPTEIKVTVALKHAMARDRDAIESVFNRGMGRIYNLPDSFAGSADYQTIVDDATKKDGRSVSVGTAPGRRRSFLYTPGQDSGAIDKPNGTPNANHSEPSVWKRASFNLGISSNSETQFITTKKDLFYSSFRTADWIAQRSLT